jgi:glycosyltransferase involved in cell wall biosynthesis
VALRAGVVIPVHGFSPYLVQTLEAVLLQTEPAVQVIVVDDGSPRGLALPSGHGDMVRVIRLDAPSGPGAARNAGVAALRDDVDVVAFCDHDDVWGPGHLAAHARAMDRHPDVQVFSGDALLVGPDDRSTGELWPDMHHGVHRWFLVLPTIYERDPLCLSATVVRRAGFDAIGGFDERLSQAEDLDLWLRLLENESDLVSVLGATVRYRRHPGGLTHDLVGLAHARMRVHREHADAVRPVVVRRAESADLRSLGTGLARIGCYAEARDAYARADELLRPLPAERLRAAALAVPWLREHVGRARPYGR